MRERVEVKVPVRVDLAGGWTDVSPYTSDYGGEVVNFAINKYIRCSMEIDEKGRKKVEYSSDVPTGSGLGTSGAMNVGLIATIIGGDKEPEEIAELAYKFEELLDNLGGRQDQWVAAKGGFNHMLFLGEEVEPMPFEPMKSSKNWLKKYFIIAHSGISHVSGDIHKSIWERYGNGDSEVIEGLHCIRSAARVMANGLQKDRREMVVKALKEVSRGVDLLDREIHNPFRNIMDPLTENKSVISWKALGAGGGGSIGILCSSSGKDAVVKAITDAGWENMEWDYDEHGIQVNRE